MAAALRLGDESEEGVVRRLLVEPVQVEPRGYRVEPALEPTQGPPVEGARGGWTRRLGGQPAAAPGENSLDGRRFAGERGLLGPGHGDGRGKRGRRIAPSRPLDPPDDFADGVVPERQLEGGRHACAATHQGCDPGSVDAAAGRAAPEHVARRRGAGNA
jgi:hypothetical protein